MKKCLVSNPLTAVAGSSCCICYESILLNRFCTVMDSANGDWCQISHMIVELMLKTMDHVITERPFRSFREECWWHPRS